MLHAQGVEWASLIHGMETEIVHALCHDASGNIYATGRMSNGNIDGMGVPVDGTNDIFLAKYNASGALQWVVTPGGSDLNDPNESDSGWNLAYDEPTGSIYLCGTYQALVPPPATFGPGISVFGDGSFVAKYDTNGTCLWMRASSSGLAHEVTVDGSGAVHVHGYSTEQEGEQTTFFGPPSVTIPSGPFVVKYTSEGQLVWAKMIGQGFGARMQAVQDRIYVGGGTYGSDPSFLGVSLPSEPSSIGIIAEVDTSFTTIHWMDVCGSNSSASIMDMDVSGTGDLHLLGSFQDSVFLPTDTLVQLAGGFGIFLLQLDQDGEVQCSAGFSVGMLHARSITVAPDGSSYVGLTFGGALTITLHFRCGKHGA